MSRPNANWLLLVCCASFYAARSAPTGDEVATLPGWSAPLPSKQYSGFVNATARSTFHYWFILSENEPKTDPLLVWVREKTQ